MGELIAKGSGSETRRRAGAEAGWGSAVGFEAGWGSAVGFEAGWGSAVGFEAGWRAGLEAGAETEK